MAGERCEPPKGQRVTGHWRAAPRTKRRIGPRKGETYYVAEDKHGNTCGHHHKTFTGAHACATRANKRAYRKSERPDFVTDRRTA